MNMKFNKNANKRNLNKTFEWKFNYLQNQTKIINHNSRKQNKNIACLFSLSLVNYNEYNNSNNNNNYTNVSVTFNIN